MNTTPANTSPDTEIIHRPFAPFGGQDVLRTIPQVVGADLFSDQPITVFANLGGRRGNRGDDPTFHGGGFIVIGHDESDHMPDQYFHLSEDAAIALVGALALAVRDLHAVREAQS